MKKIILLTILISIFSAQSLFAKEVLPTGNIGQNIRQSIQKKFERLNRERGIQNTQQNTKKTKKLSEKEATLVNLKLRKAIISSAITKLEQSIAQEKNSNIKK